MPKKDINMRLFLVKLHKKTLFFSKDSIWFIRAKDKITALKIATNQANLVDKNWMPWDIEEITETKIKQIIEF